MESFVENWKNEIKVKPKLELYLQIKTHWKTEGFLKVYLDKCKRCLIARLLCGVLPLANETGRYYGIVRDQRICYLCKNDVESELHFLFECNKTNKVRTDLLYRYPEILNYCTNVDKPNVKTLYIREFHLLTLAGTRKTNDD